MPRPSIGSPDGSQKSLVSAIPQNGSTLLLTGTMSPLDILTSESSGADRDLGGAVALSMAHDFPDRLPDGGGASAIRLRSRRRECRPSAKSGLWLERRERHQLGGRRLRSRIALAPP